MHGESEGQFWRKPRSPITAMASIPDMSRDVREKQSARKPSPILVTAPIPDMLRYIKEWQWSRKSSPISVTAPIPERSRDVKEEQRAMTDSPILVMFGSAIVHDTTMLHECKKQAMSSVPNVLQHDVERGRDTLDLIMQSLLSRRTKRDPSVVADEREEVHLEELLDALQGGWREGAVASGERDGLVTDVFGLFVCHLSRENIYGENLYYFFPKTRP